MRERPECRRLFTFLAAVDEKLMFSSSSEGDSWTSFLGWTQVLDYKNVHIVVMCFKCFCFSGKMRSSLWIAAASVCSARPRTYADPTLMFVCVCWLTACQRRGCTHMAGGWDIPARTLRAQTALLSRAAVAFTPGAQTGVQKLTQIPRCLPSGSLRATARRYQCRATASSSTLCAFLACLSLSLIVCLRVNTPKGAVASGQLMAGVGRDRGMRNVCELEEREDGWKGADWGSSGH